MDSVFLGIVTLVFASSLTTDDCSFAYLLRRLICIALAAAFIASLT
jgi:hypothetical protein